MLGFVDSEKISVDKEINPKWDTKKIIICFATVYIYIYM